MTTTAAALMPTTLLKKESDFFILLFIRKIHKMNNILITDRMKIDTFSRKDLLLETLQPHEPLSSPDQIFPSPFQFALWSKNPNIC